MKHVLITGGSRGIGAAAVRAFCGVGCAVTFFYEKSHAQAAALAEQNGACAVCCDVADAEPYSEPSGRWLLWMCWSITRASRTTG